MRHDTRQDAGGEWAVTGGDSSIPGGDGWRLAITACRVE